jgi:hypothetical protein
VDINVMEVLQVRNKEKLVHWILATILAEEAVKKQIRDSPFRVDL